MFPKPEKRPRLSPRRIRRRRSPSAKRFELKQAGRGVDPDTWVAIVKWYGGNCAYCRTEILPLSLQQDHVVPLSKGGEHCAENVVPACPACNLTKGTLSAEAYCRLRRWPELKMHPYTSDPGSFIE